MLKGTLSESHLFSADVGKERILITSYSKDKQGTPLDYIMLISTGERIDPNKREVFNFLDHLYSKKKRLDSDKKFLEYIFYKVHSKYLRIFESLTDFYQILEQGNYNCLTATAF